MCFCEATSFPEAIFFSIAWRTFYFSWKVTFENAQKLTSHVWLSSQEWKYLSTLICEKKTFQTLYFCSRHCHTYFKLFSNKFCRTPLICLCIFFEFGMQDQLSLWICEEITFLSSFFVQNKTWFWAQPEFWIKSLILFKLRFLMWVCNNAQFSGLWFSEVLDL